jgi:GntR family transcriptional repressor for pyruvate dehydrogenase complex
MADGVVEVFSEIRSVRSFEDVVAQIEAAVTSGRLRNGERLPNEHDLAARLGVSRPTVREGLRVLEAGGLVEVRRGANGGVFVSEPGAEQVAKPLQALMRFRRATASDLAEFRSSFEGETAAWAARRASAADLRQLKRLADEYSYKANVEETAWPELVELDVAFHQQVAYASGNQVRVAIMLAIQGSLHDASLGLTSDANQKFRRREAQELRAIARAIEDGDASRARQLMRRHVKWNAALEARV